MTSPHEYELRYCRCHKDVHGRVTYEAAKQFAPDPMDPAPADVDWPGGAPFAAWASHDVDWFWSPRIRVYEAKRHLQSRRVVDAGRMLVGRNGSKLGKITDIDESLGVRSTFFVMADAYRLSSSVLGDMIGRGFEIGLHGSYESYLNQYILLTEKFRLANLGVKVKVEGVRQHYLRFDYPGTWAVQSGVFGYDSTVGWIDQIGYRSGCCVPFQTPFGILEIPVAVQDVTLYEVRSIGWPELKALVDAVAERGGLFSYLWHNGSLSDMASRPWDPWGETYVKLTKYLKEKGAVFLTGSELAAMKWK